jgi:biopolymer transport protein ExbB
LAALVHQTVTLSIYHPGIMKTSLTTLFNFAIFGFLLLINISESQAKWKPEWKERLAVVLDTSATGAATKTTVNQSVVPVRLHTGNFEFAKAKPDGSDLRFIAADDKTELPFQIEYFDPSNELAVVWVAMPSLLPNAGDQKIFLYYGNPAAASSSGSSPFDAGVISVVHGPDAQGALVDASARKAVVAATGATAEIGGALGSAIKLSGSGAITISGPAVKLEATGLSVSFWVRAPVAPTGSLVKLATTSGSFEVNLNAGIPEAALLGSFGATTAKGTTPLAPAVWTHFLVNLGESMTVSMNGVQALTMPSKINPEEAQIVFGTKLAADFDELQVYSSPRTPDWLKAGFAAQGSDGKMVRVEGEEKGSEASYLKILVDNLPVDAIVVIALLGVMALVAIWVIFNKALLLVRVSKGNTDFLKRYRELGEHVFVSDKIPKGVANGGYANSSLYPVFEAARTSMYERLPGGKGKLEARSMPSIKSSVDTAVVGENTKMNRWMVLLTIAISGGPFLGLLGTVVGVMITFAAIAAVGDVNINAIAPGIAAALLATVAGLAVAIPALFAYNYLASRVKEVTTDTAVFGEEVISRMSESHGQ